MDGWRRHMTLAMFALAYLAVLRARLQDLQAQQVSVTPRETTRVTAKRGRISSRST